MHPYTLAAAQEALNAALARMRSFYIGRGYWSATVNASNLLGALPSLSGF
jgi:hypothetical protein